MKKKNQRKRLVYRAVMIHGVVHGGGGVEYGVWRRTWAEADADGAKMRSPCGDSFACVEAQRKEWA